VFLLLVLLQTFKLNVNYLYAALIQRIHFGALFIPVTPRVKEYTRFVGKYVTGKRKRFRPHKVFILLIRIPRRVDLAMSVCPYNRRDLENDKS